MKIIDFMNDLYDWTNNEPGLYKNTCDTLKAGNPDEEIKKIATAMFPTIPVIRAAAEWGANLLIVHEPTFYDNMDDMTQFEKWPKLRQDAIRAKQEFIRKCGMTIYRYHDHPHSCHEDVISKGEVKYWGLSGKWERGKAWARNRFTLDEPMSVMDLAKALEKNLNIQRVRIAGSTKTTCRKIALNFGTPGGIAEDLEECDVLLTGEISEWTFGEMARDYTDLIGDKSIIVMGHIGSERDGMRLLVDMIKERHSEFDVRYFECGEVYSYTH